ALPFQGRTVRQSEGTTQGRGQSRHRLEPRIEGTRGGHRGWPAQIDLQARSGGQGDGQSGGQGRCPCPTTVAGASTGDRSGDGGLGGPAKRKRLGRAGHSYQALRVGELSRSNI